MNKFLQATNNAVNKHGTNCNYIKVLQGVYDVNTGSVVNTETVVAIKVYKKHIKATQFSYPNLIGKDLALFYIPANSLLAVPEPGDRLISNSIAYTIDSYQEHCANGEIVLYKVIATMG